MKSSRFTETQIIAILKEADAGVIKQSRQDHANHLGIMGSGSRTKKAVDCGR